MNSRPFVGVAVIVHKDGKVLLGQTSRTYVFAAEKFHSTRSSGSTLTPQTGVTQFLLELIQNLKNRYSN